MALTRPSPPKARVNHAPVSGGAKPRQRPMSLRARSEKAVPVYRRLESLPTPALSSPSPRGRGPGVRASVVHSSTSATSLAGERVRFSVCASGPRSPKQILGRIGQREWIFMIQKNSRIRQ